MTGWLAITITAGTVIALFLSGLWASKRFAKFDQLPGHFDFAGRATRLTSRSTMVWLLPVFFSVMMVAIVIALYFVDPVYRNGDPLLALVITSASLLGSQAFVLRLTSRWADRQRRD